MGICAEQIAEFWKEYYQRTQNNFQQQQQEQQHASGLTKQLHHVEQGNNPVTSTIGSLTQTSFPQPPQQHQHQQSAMLIPGDIVQTHSNSVGSTVDDLMKPQSTIINNNAIQKFQTGVLTNLHPVQTQQNGTQEKIVSDKQDQGLNQQQQTFPQVKIFQKLFLTEMFVNIESKAEAFIYIMICYFIRFLETHKIL